MQKALYLLLLVAALTPATSWCQKASSSKSASDLPVVETPGPNGPWVVTVASKGQYKVAEVYTVNDLVLHNGDRYVSMAAENRGNEPVPTSSLWLRLPEYKGEVTLASWGTAPAVNGDARVSMKSKHFKNATSYGCGLTSDLLTVPSSNPPTLGEKGNLHPPAPKAKFTYTSGEAFAISGVPVSPAGYVCAGS